MSQIDDVRSKTDIVEVIGASGVSLRKTGRSFVGFCPFHPNSRTPAFTVYPDSQSFYCFGCHASGTVFDYVMRKQGLDFKDALEQLAARAGVRLEPRGDQERQEDARRTRLLEINAAAAKYFNYVLLSLARGQPGRDYVERRGLTPETVESFQVGYSMDDWGHLFTYLTGKKGYPPEDVVAAGLAIDHETRGPYDRFRGRLIFPIRDARGQVVGFGGRALGDAQPKYLNTPETLLFKKGELLYGLDLARDAIRDEDRTVVVEGYVDVITAHQHGFRNVVAPLGTAITKGHVALLKRLSHNVYMALDADAAGQKATLKGLNALRDGAEEGEGGHLVATAQGAVRLESDVSLRIIRMPEGRDPDEVIKADPDLWRQLVADAVPVMEFYIGTYTGGLDLGDPQGQRAALDKLLPLLSELDGAQQRVYIARLEQVIGIKAELILDLLRGGRSKGAGSWGLGVRERTSGAGSRKSHPNPQPPTPNPQPPTPNPQPPTPKVENYLLALALRHNTVVPAAVEALLEQGIEAHPAVRELLGGGLEDVLEDPANQQIWAAFMAMPIESRPTDEAGLEAWAGWLEEPLRERYLALLAGAQRNPQDFRHRREAEDCARGLRLEQARRMHRMLLQRIAEPDAGESDHSAELRQMAALAQFIADSTAPRRSSTFPDIRDTLGKV
ncbi:DNA primase [Chloroflexales bacterium ZM16-3]|nr:DNA primase [Chloroflexales bacterium ZM16-3]